MSSDLLVCETQSNFVHKPRVVNLLRPSIVNR